MGWDGGFNALFKWKIVPCSTTHRYICQRKTTTTKPRTKTASISTVKVFTSSYTIVSTAAIVNNGNLSDTSLVGYAMIGVGAIIVLVICGIIYIKYYRNTKPTTDNVHKRNSGSEEDDDPVVVENVLYGTSAEPIQDLYEEADNASTDNGQNETEDNSRGDPSEDVYTQVEKQK
uniref:uncharacterized protein LOC113475414 n=1 Tax=Ciona intestinalis TaxID=7719 RepID=UPI000EF4BB03|nr:uncharacterized protein LOC113475414 [Ciona intestinalis]|eukprot:XP_026695370.1 uncharacterized protein LOC113475414 [Ciona intestinalis]